MINIDAQWISCCAAMVITMTIVSAPVHAQDTRTHAADFGFHGYMRSGYGINGKGGHQASFKALNADAKYRLGLETWW